MPNNSSLLTDQIKSLLRKIHWIEDSILALILFGMIVLATSQIFLRNLFDSGIIWADPLLRVMVLWIGLLGALAATRENKHITIDLLTRFLSDSMRDVAKAFTNLFSSFIAAILAYHSLRFVIMEYDAQSKAFSNISAWILELILPIAFGFIALRFFLHFIINVRAVLARKNKQ